MPEFTVFWFLKALLAFTIAHQSCCYLIGISHRQHNLKNVIKYFSLSYISGFHLWYMPSWLTLHLSSFRSLYILKLQLHFYHIWKLQIRLHLHFHSFSLHSLFLWLWEYKHEHSVLGVWIIMAFLAFSSSLQLCLFCSLLFINTYCPSVLSFTLASLIYWPTLDLFKD